MKKTTRTRRKPPEMLALQRQQLDRRLNQLQKTSTPSGGWIRTIREALGMSYAQLGNRLRISPQSVQELEERERSETITLERLRNAAEAMNCELRIAVVPRTSLEAIVREQAELKARQLRNKLVHTMSLEAQEAGVEAVLDDPGAVEQWLTKRARRLWD